MLFLTRLSYLLRVSTLAHLLLRTQLLSLDSLWTAQALLHSRPLGPHQIRFICPHLLGLSYLSPPFWPLKAFQLQLLLRIRSKEHLPNLMPCPES